MTGNQIFAVSLLSPVYHVIHPITQFRSSVGEPLAHSLALRRGFTVSLPSHNFLLKLSLSFSAKERKTIRTKMPDVESATDSNLSDRTPDSSFERQARGERIEGDRGRERLKARNCRAAAAIQGIQWQQQDRALSLSFSVVVVDVSGKRVSGSSE